MSDHDPAGAAEDETIQEFLYGRFRILQKRRGVRFSLDPVLLAAFARVRPRDQIIDLGTGTGVLPLLLSERVSRGRIVGLEIQEAYADMARRSVALNGLADRIEIQCGDVRRVRERFPAESFDAVVGNPPFRTLASGAPSPKGERALARHELAGGMADFLAAARYLLRQRGRAFFVYPAARAADLLHGLREARLEPRRMRLVHPRPEAPATLVLAEGVKGARPGLTVLAPLFVFDAEGAYTPEVAEILHGKG